MDSSVIRGLDLAVPAESHHLHASHSSPLVPLRAWASADNVPSGSQGARSVLPNRVHTSTRKVQDGETIPDNRRASSANFDPSVGLGTSDLNIPRHRSAADILSDLVPNSSVLQRSIDQRRSTVWLIDSDDDAFLGSVNWMQDITKLQKKILESRSRLAAGSVLVIEDLNTKTCEVLGLEYPYLDQAFLVEHMLRFDELPTNAVLEDLNSHWLEADRIHVERFSLFSGTYMGTDLVLKSPLLARDERSFHLDLKCEFRFEFHRAITAPLNVLETMHGVSVPSSRLRSESFARSVDGVWRKSSTRISCCRLPGNSVLVLVDAAFDISQDVYVPYKLPRSGTLPAGLPSSHRRILQERHGFSRKAQPRFALAALLRAYSKQSVFDPPVLHMEWNVESQKLEPDSGRILVAFMNAAFWEFECLRLQEDIQYVRSYAMQNPGERSFPILLGIRGHLSRVSDGLKKTRMSISRAREGRSFNHGWFVARKDGRYDHQLGVPPKLRKDDNLPVAMVSSTDARPCFLDWRQLLDMLDQLGKWIDLSTKLINEEIQLVIGAVQIEDARVMKRQTERTVVLGVLAAIYLPMTLVTGIFGMNITEITTDESAPNRWSVVKAWGVAFGATLSIVLLNLAFRVFHRCWLIARYVYRRAYEDREYRWLEEGIEKLHEMRQALQNWSLVRTVSALIRRVRELDLEAQKMD